jgi:SAM-dependent methyltransferase
MTGYAAGDEYVKYAAVYDVLFADLLDDEQFYSKAAAACLRPGEPLLELGTGTGRLAERLLEAGHALVGVDVSAAMLDKAQAKLAGYGDRYRGVHADVGAMSLGRTFSLAIVPYGTMAHFLTDEDRTRAFRAVFEHLEPGGTFVFDDMPGWLGAPSDSSRLELRRTGFDPVAEMPVRLLSNTMEAAGQPLSVRYDIIDWLAGAEVAKRVIVRVVFRNIALEEEKALLRAAGFEHIEVLGGFDGRAFDLDDLGRNDRLIVRCRRPS